MASGQIQLLYVFVSVSYYIHACSGYINMGNPGILILQIVCLQIFQTK